MKKINTQVSIIIAALIIGVSLYAVQANKQTSIERQSREKIAQENKILSAKSLKESYKKIDLDRCLSAADSAYWTYMELNGTKNDDWSITASNRFWDDATENKERDEDVCFKKYK